MRSAVIALLLLAGASMALAHSLTPPTRIIRFVQGVTEFELEAINAFDYSEEFNVEVWEDESFSYQIDHTAYPQSMYLAPHGRRYFRVRLDEVEIEDFLVCTATNVGFGSTRVCSKVYVCPGNFSNTECKKRFSKRRNSDIERY